MRAAIILNGYPRLSEPFIAQEILELQKRGLSMEIVSLRYPTDSKKHPIHDEIVAPVRYLPEYLYKEIGRVQVCGKNWCHPAYSNGKLLIRDSRKLICLDFKS